MILVLTCEHAGNFVPERYGSLFEGREDVLNSHRGLDPGALDLFQELRSEAVFSNYQLLTRLLIEMNRSLNSSSLFSEFSNSLSAGEKENLIREYYKPYRDSVESAISRHLKKDSKVLHLSVHSFTPVLNGEERKADIGLLFDPSRTSEKEFCKGLKNGILRRDPGLKVRFNYPYKGTADGFTTFLRRKFKENYLGIEIEVNQKFVRDNKMVPQLKEQISHSLSDCLS